MQGVFEVLKIVIAFLGKALFWVFEAFLWLSAIAGGIDNLIAALVVAAIVIFGPGLWLAKHLRDKEERARAEAELRAWKAAHELTAEEEEALRIAEGAGHGSRTV